MMTIAVFVFTTYRTDLRQMAINVALGYGFSRLAQIAMSNSLSKELLDMGEMFLKWKIYILCPGTSTPSPQKPPEAKFKNTVGPVNRPRNSFSTPYGRVTAYFHSWLGYKKSLLV